MPHFNKNIINVVGTYYYNVYGNKSLIQQLTKNNNILLIRELDNEYDINAVAVYIYHNNEKTQLGHIPRVIAAKLAPILDRGCDYNCYIEQIRGSKNQPNIIINITTFPKAGKTIPLPKTGIGPTEARPYPVITTPTGKRFRRINNFNTHCNKWEGISGIYIIWNRDEKIYVGQSMNVGDRWKQHRNQLLNRIHTNKSLQNDWVQMGVDNFRFDMIEEVNPSNLDERETYWINFFNTFHEGYNTTSNGQPHPFIKKAAKPPSVPDINNENTEIPENNTGDDSALPLEPIDIDKISPPPPFEPIDIPNKNKTKNLDYRYRNENRFIKPIVVAFSLFAFLLFITMYGPSLNKNIKSQKTSRRSYERSSSVHMSTPSKPIENDINISKDKNNSAFPEKIKSSRPQKEKLLQNKDDFSSESHINYFLYLRNGKVISCERIWRENNMIYIVHHGKKFAVGYPENEVDLTKTFKP